MDFHVNKTQALIFNFAQSRDLKKKYKFNTDSTSIEYVGIILTEDMTQLFFEKYASITPHIKEDLDRRTSLSLDLCNRIMTI